jgi:hypothetical protein
MGPRQYPLYFDQDNGAPLKMRALIRGKGPSLGFLFLWVLFYFIAATVLLTHGPRPPSKEAFYDFSFQSIHGVIRCKLFSLKAPNAAGFITSVIEKSPQASSGYGSVFQF